MPKKNTLFILLKILVIIFALVYITDKLIQNDNFFSLISLFDKTTISDYFILFLVFLLMIINWLLEAIKWQLLVKKVEKVSLVKSYVAILAGLTASIFTPNRIGEYFGRVLVLKSRHRVGGAVSTIVGSMSQLLITIILGSLSLIIFIKVEGLVNNTFLQFFIQASVLLFLLVITTLFFRIEKIKPFLYKFKYFRRNKNKISILKSYKFKALIRILAFSFLRYLTFTFQYFLLLNIFSVEISYIQALYSISLVYLVSATIPTFTLAEIGVKGSAAIFFIGIFSGNIIGIVSATLLLWIINVAIPSVLGTFVIYKLKI